MIKKLELYVRNIIQGRKKGFFPFLVLLLLWPLSWIYQSAVTCRNWFYDKGWMKRYIPPVPLVISIGNIVAGGTGKTPVTLLFAQAFYGRFHLAILSRGYRSKAEKLDMPLILCEGQGPLYPAAYCGDEPYIYAQRLPRAHVIVGGNRKKASYLAAKAGSQIILLDDGMQHRRLARDFDVVVIDVLDPFGQGYFLPRGFLREDISSLSRANLVVLNHVVDPQQFQTVKNQINHYTSAPTVGTNWQIARIRNLKGQDLESLKDKKVGMFCGIAHPEYFRKTLEREGAKIVAEYWLPDHMGTEEKELERFVQVCVKSGAQLLICTEKDRVKLKDQLVLDLPVAWLQMELQVIEGQEEWQRFLRQAEAKIV